MKTSLKGMIEIAESEGIALSPYFDSVGVKTIGLGSTRADIPDLNSWPLSRTITLEEAFSLFQSHLVKYEVAVNNALTREVKQYEFDALVSWCYNVGPGWLKKASVISLINKGISGKPLYDALMLYNKPKEIIGRRTREANLLAYGDYNYGGNNLVNVFPVSASGKPIYSKGKLVDPLLYIKDREDVTMAADVVGFEDIKLKLNNKLLDFVNNLFSS